ncbi:unnamed protein product [Ilex paraguariensis]|uniref:Uncharacterized protein n=1 Tax=Ilex paraguariensis TaxID=185542 RepID=A0ABC8U680_9AQUA
MTEDARIPQVPISIPTVETVAPSTPQGNPTPPSVDGDISTVPVDTMPPSRSVDSFSASNDELFWRHWRRHRDEVTGPS